jgi:hypothetical protein
MRRSANTCLLASILGGCNMLAGGYTYKAGVGYFNDGKETWYMGDNKSYDACMSEARSYFASLNTPSNPKRAFSWACRKMQGDSFLERVR